MVHIKNAKRILSLALCLLMLVGLFPVSALAAAEDGICEHHSHDGNCGYAEAVEAQPCTHQCTENCTMVDVTVCVHDHAVEGCAYTPAEDAVDCDHQHGESCGYIAPQDAVAEYCAHVHGDCAYREAKPEIWGCAHVCTKESGCIKAVCAHEHDSNCGYVASVEGKGCSFVCEECKAEEEKVCTCESVDPGEHAPFCALYVRTYEPCLCVLSCAEEGLNDYCETCYFEGVEACNSGEDEDVPYETGTIGDLSYTLEDNVLTISGSGSLGNSAFDSNKDIVSVIIEDGVTSIGNYAFKGCARLESVSIPASVSTIGNYAFYGCSSLATVSYWGTLAPEAASGAFSNTSVICVGVPENYVGEAFCGLNVSKTLGGGTTPEPETTYTVSVSANPTEGGTVTASHTSAAAGTEVTLIATPNEGYQFKKWEVISGGVTVTDDKFAVGTANVEIKAIFEAIPTAAEHKHALCSGSEEITWTPITKLSDITGPGNYYLDGNPELGYFDRTISGNGTVNLCLNGVTVTYSSEITVAAGTTLNICDCKTGSVGFPIVNQGTTNIYSGAFVKKITNKDKLNIYGGSFITDDYTASVHNNNGTLVIENGTFGNNSGNAVENDGGSISISNGNFTSTRCSVFNDDGTLEISGGTYTSTGSYATVDVDGGSATIYDGTFTHTNGAFALRITSSATSLTVTDGTFSSTGDAVCGNAGILDIQGGTFTTTGNEKNVLIANAAVNVSGGQFTNSNEDKAWIKRGTNGRFQLSGGIFTGGLRLNLANVNDGGPVLPGSLADGYAYYQNNQVYEFGPGVNTQIIKDGDVTVKQMQTVYTVTADPTEGGTVTGGGTYESGASVTVTATPNAGYNFVSWTENGQQISTEASYTFTVSADRTLTAVFEEKPLEISLSIGTADTNTTTDLYYGDNGIMYCTFTFSKPVPAGRMEMYVDGVNKNAGWNVTASTGTTVQKTRSTGINLKTGENTVKFEFVPSGSTESVFTNEIVVIMHKIDTTRLLKHISNDEKAVVVEYDGTAKAAEVQSLYNESNTLYLGPEDYTITYWKDGVSTTAPIEPGVYQVKLSIHGNDYYEKMDNVPLTATLTINPPPHAHSWVYSVNDAQNTITATCSNEDSSCPNTDGGSVTISASDSSYDGAAKSASLSAESVGGLDNLSSHIQYKNGNDVLSSAPSKAGTYTASLTVDGDKTIAVEYSISRKTVSITGLSAVDRAYNGSVDVELKDGNVDGALSADDVKIDFSNAKATVGNANVGNKKPVTVSGLSLAGDDADNYELTAQPTGIEVNISKVDATATTGQLTIMNNLAKTYIYDLSQLLPGLTDECSYGNVTYELKNVRINLAGYYTDGAAITGSRLSLPIASVNNSVEGELGSISVGISSDNYSFADASITVLLSNKSALDIGGVTAASGLVYNGSSQSGYTGTPTATGYNGSFEISYSGTKADGSSYGPSSEPPVNAGSYTVTFSIPGTNENYTGSEALNFAIDRAVVTVTAHDKAVRLGEAKPELTYSYTGFIGSDKFVTAPTLSCDADMSKAGEYAITGSGAEASDNYTISYVNGKLTVSDVFDIYINDSRNGKVASSHISASVGTTVTLTAKGNTNYTLNVLEVYDASGHKLTLTSLGGGKYSFTMPASDVGVHASFRLLSPYGSPATGDHSNMGLWTAMLLMSVIGIGTVLLSAKKRKAEK